MPQTQTDVEQLWRDFKATGSRTLRNRLMEEIQRRDLRDLVTRGLARAERLILILYYYEEMTMKEIGATLDLSESSVSQMHSSILNRLTNQLRHRHRELRREAEG